MRSSSWFIATACLLTLVGAGCASPSKPVKSEEPVPAPAVEAPVVPEAVPSEVTSTPADASVTSTPVTTSTTPVATKPVMQPTTPAAFPGILPAAEVNKKIRIKTSQGDIVIQLSAEMGPRAASNFIYLVKRGFYNGTIFHRVIPGFMIQGGDPTGTGTGGPGYQFQNDEVKQPYQDGIVAMANAGRDTNGSQFFIMVADYPLAPDYSVFGKVVEGLNVAHAIAASPRDGSDRPKTEVKMISVTVE